MGDISREEFIKNVKKYDGVKYQHLGRDKTLDCLGLVIKNLQDFNINTDFDEVGYQRIPDNNKLVKKLHEHAICLHTNDLSKAKNGDILLITFLNSPQHLAFFYRENEINYMIHAYGDEQINRVICQRIDKKWEKRIINIFKIKELKE